MKVFMSILASVLLMTASAPANTLFYTFGIDGKTLINESLEFADGQQSVTTAIDGYILIFSIDKQSESDIEVSPIVIKNSAEDASVLANPQMAARWEETAEIIVSDKYTLGSSLHLTILPRRSDKK